MKRSQPALRGLQACREQLQTGQLKLPTVRYVFCTVCLSSSTVGITIFGRSQIRDTDKPVSLTDKLGSVTNRPLS